MFHSLIKSSFYLSEQENPLKTDGVYIFLLQGNSRSRRQDDSDPEESKKIKGTTISWSEVVVITLTLYSIYTHFIACATSVDPDKPAHP
jgi:hypothetical protein